MFYKYNRAIVYNDRVLDLIILVVSLILKGVIIWPSINYTSTEMQPIEMQKVRPLIGLRGTNKCTTENIERSDRTFTSQRHGEI